MWLPILFVLLIGTILFWNGRKYWEGMPPGDWTWPFIGKIIFSPEAHFRFISEQKKKYGAIFRSQLGSRTYVYLTDHETIRTAFAKLEFSARPELMVGDLINSSYKQKFDQYGLAFANGPIWTENRSFAVKKLKELGMGKNFYESTIMREVTELLEFIALHCNDEVNPLEHAVQTSALNVIWQIVTSNRYSITENKVHEFQTYAQEMISGTSERYSILFDYFPSLKRVIPDFVKNKLMGFEKQEESTRKTIDFSKEIIQEHVETLDPSNPRDFIDAYLIQKEEDQKLGRKTKRNEESDLVLTIFTLFQAGADTTSMSIRSFLLHMAKFPKVQEKIHEELDRVVTGEVLPSLDDKEKLPYLEASIMEVSRRASLGPVLIPHMTDQETTLNGYRIPKDCIIMGCAEECHYDPAYWKHPQDFYPEHFIQDDGKVNYRKEGYLPFGSGRRICLGEALAKMELFLFLGAILKKFIIKPAPGEELNLTPDRWGLVLSVPKPFKVIFQKR